MDIFKKNRKHETENVITDKILNTFSMQDNKTDPDGSYTGVPENAYDKPVQDADDL